MQRTRSATGKTKATRSRTQGAAEAIEPAAKQVRNQRVSKKKTAVIIERRAAPKPKARPRPATGKLAKAAVANRYRSSKDAAPEEFYGVLDLPEPYIINKYLELRTTPDRGRGVFTRVADIPAGTLLLQETALVYNANPAHHSGKRYRELIDRLSPADQQKFMALTHHGLPNTEESRESRNCFMDEEGAHVIWFWIAMINHDCKPSCQIEISGEAPRMIGNVRNVVPLPKKGTQITVDYLLWGDWMRQTIAGRAELMFNSWGFVCDCSTCSNAARTEADFRELLRLQALIDFDEVEPETQPTKAERAKIARHIDRLLELFLDFRMFGEAYCLAYKAMDFYRRIPDDLARGHAVRWAVEAIQIGTIEIGLESIEDVEDTTAVRGSRRSVAPEPRYLDGIQVLRNSFRTLVSTILPQLIGAKFYGNLQALEGAQETSDIPRALYK